MYLVVGNLVFGFSNESHAKSREPRPSSLKCEWPTSGSYRKMGSAPPPEGAFHPGTFLQVFFSFTILFSKEEVSGMCMGVGGALLTLFVGIKSGGN